MFEQKTFARQQNSFLNGQLDANRYASVFDSASLESALTSSRSTDLRSEKSASYQEIPVAESFNQASLMDAGIATASPSSLDFTQALNTTWNPETSSVWNQSAAWGSGTIWGTDGDFSGMRPAGLSLKNAWSSVKDKAKNADWKKIGHGALDVVGALPIPVVSTAADLANAGWYAAEGDYKNAAMSAVGAVPGVGDGAKLALKAADAAKTARSARTTTRLTTRSTPGSSPRSGLAPSPRRETPGLTPTPKPAARRPETPTAAPRREPSGRPDSNPVVTPARRSARRPEPSPAGAVRNPEPRRPDPQPNPAPAKKPEPSRPEGSPPPSGSREQPPQRPAGQPEPSGARPPEQRPETPVASGRDPRLLETPGSVRPTSLERFTRASDRAEHLSQRLEHIHGHVDLLQQMQGGNAETGEPSAADFAFAAVDAFFGMRSGRGGGFNGRQNITASRDGRRGEQSATSGNLSRSNTPADPPAAGGSGGSGRDRLQIEARPPRLEIEGRSPRLEIEARPELARGTGHGHQRHGAHTRMFEQIRRIRTGIAPDGEIAPTRQATRFFSPGHEQRAVDQARRVVAQQPRFQINSKGEISPLRATVVVDGPPRHAFAVNRKGETVPVPMRDHRFAVDTNGHTVREQMNPVVLHTASENFENGFRGYGDGFKKVKLDANGNLVPLPTGIGSIHHSQVRDASGQETNVYVQRVDPLQQAKVVFDYNPTTGEWDDVTRYPSNGNVGVTLSERRWPPNPS